MEKAARRDSSTGGDALNQWRPSLHRCLSKAGLEPAQVSAAAQAVLQDFQQFFAGSTLYIRRRVIGTAPRAAAVDAWLKRGKTPRQIAAIEGISTAYVYRLIKSTTTGEPSPPKGST